MNSPSIGISLLISSAVVYNIPVLACDNDRRSDYKNFSFTISANIFAYKCDKATSGSTAFSLCASFSCSLMLCAFSLIQ
ncbi:hypothetical protein V1527DRAFT_478473 [Lipomyces starkeyi]